MHVTQAFVTEFSLSEHQRGTARNVETSGFRPVDIRRYQSASAHLAAEGQVAYSIAVGNVLPESPGLATAVATPAFIRWPYWLQVH
jgi:hypothetical protein